MNENPYQPPVTEIESVDDLSQRLRAMRMKHLLRIFLGAVAVAVFSALMLVVFGWSLAPVIWYAAGGFFAISTLTVVIANMWLLGMSIVSCARYNRGVGYLLTSLVLPVALFLMIAAR